MGGLETGEGAMLKGPGGRRLSKSFLLYGNLLKGGGLSSAARFPTMMPCYLAGDPEATG